MSEVESENKIKLIDFSHENEPDISIFSTPEASISEIWGPYPFKPKCQIEWDTKINEISSQVADINPYLKHKNPGEEISALEAINWIKGQFGQVDFRPKLFDNITKTYTLCDTGAMLSCVPKQPGDVVDPTTTLKTADGKPMKTYGSKELNIRLGRKNYSIKAVVTDVTQRILGMDFFQKYKLGFEWISGDLYVVDRKANISKQIKFVTIEENSLPTAQAHLAKVKSDQNAIQFEIDCVKKLASSNLEESQEIFPELKANKMDDILLEKVPVKFQNLIKKLDILVPNYKIEPKHGISHKIETGQNSPATCKVRPIPADLLPQVKKMFQEMQEAGVISRVNGNSNTKWSSALHVVRKSDQKPRICGDYRLLNSKIVCDSYPLPLMRDISQKLHGSKIFTKIDLKKAYWNIPLENKHKSTLVTPFGAYFFNRLPFGIASAPASYQKAMDTIFHGIPDLFIYMDDLLIFSKSQSEHEQTVEQVLRKLHDNGMAISLNKCVWQAPEVEYLGYLVSENGIKPLPKKLQAVTNIAPPRKQKDLLAFLGAANFYRRSLSGLRKNNKYYNTAALIQCLYQLATETNLNAKKFQEKWESDTKYAQAFEDAKQLLKNAANLVHLDPNAPLALFVDASDVSIGGKLCQLTNKGWSAIGYYSKTLSDSQKNWSVYNKELHSLHLSIRHFLPEILGRNLTCFTDHKAISDAFKRPDLKQNDAKSARKLLEISQFTKNVLHIAGNENLAADYLSRCDTIKKPLQAVSKEDIYQPFYPLLEEGSLAAITNSEKTRKIQTALGVGSIQIDEIGAESIEIQADDIRKIAQAQENCPETLAAKAKKHKNTTKFAEVKFGDFSIMCELSAQKPRPLIPAELRNYYIKTLHSIGHPSIKETVHRLASNYFWNKLSSEVTEFVKKCHQCLSVKASMQKSPHVGQFDVPEDRFSHLMVDIIELPVSEDGHKYCFTVCCRTSRYFSAYAMKLATTENCMKGLMDFISHFGIPRFLSSDSGSQFLSSLWQQLESTLGIDLKKGALYRPQSVGMVERSHRTFKNALKTQILDFATKNQRKWPQLLPWALLSMRASYRSDLKASPSELAHGLKPALPGSLLYNTQPSPPLQELVNNVKQKTSKKPVQTKMNVPNPIVEEPPMDVTHVYTRQHKQYGLDPPYVGPFKIKERLSRSKVRIIVGHYANGTERTEDRFWGDLKAIKLSPDVVEESRPKLGRPAKNSTPSPIQTSGPPKTQAFTGFNPTEIPKKKDILADCDWSKWEDAIKNVSAIDFSKPPPSTNTWSASKSELKAINQAINAKQ